MLSKIFRRSMTCYVPVLFVLEVDIEVGTQISLIWTRIIKHSPKHLFQSQILVYFLLCIANNSHDQCAVSVGVYSQSTNVSYNSTQTQVSFVPVQIPVSLMLEL